MSRDEDQECTYHPGAPFFHDAYKGTVIDRVVLDTELAGYPALKKIRMISG